MGHQISRRRFLKNGAIVLGTVAVADLKGLSSAIAAQEEKSRVFFTNDLTAAGLLRI